MSKFRFYVIPLTITALALALNLHHLSVDSLWEDEILTATFASRSAAEVIHWTAGDIHPPLYYLLAGNFASFVIGLGTTTVPTPASDWLWRFPSVLAGVLTIAVTYRLTCLLQTMLGLKKSPNFAGVTALLLCFAPIAIKYNQEARMHALFMFWSALTTWLFFRAWLTNPRQNFWRYWLPFAIATTANLYTVYFGFLVLANQVIFGILDYSMKKPHRFLKPVRFESKIKNLFMAVTLALLFYLPWWPILLNILRRRATVGAIEGGVGDSSIFLMNVVKSLGPLPLPVAWGFFGLFIIGLLLLARRAWPLAIFAGLWLGLPSALPILLGDPRALQFRYAFILPIYLMVVAYAAWQISAWLFARSPYLFWLLLTCSFIGTLGIYQQTKPNWRAAATYLNERVSPADVILFGALWDEGRFIGYYYHGRAQLLSPSFFVANLEQNSQLMRQNNGRVWAVNRFAPTESAIIKNHDFSGVVISEPRLAVYEPAMLTKATLDLATQAVDQAYPWATAAEAQGVLNPDPRTARASALRALGDTLISANRLAEAVTAYQTAVKIFPGWVDGFLALAETEEQLGHLEAAAKAYQQAVAFNPKWQGNMANEATDLLEASEWAKALEKYHQIVGRRK